MDQSLQWALLSYPCFTFSPSDYIDEVFGGESLWPSEPHLKAKARLLVNDFEATVSCVHINETECVMCMGMPVCVHNTIINLWHTCISVFPKLGEILQQSKR